MCNRIPGKSDTLGRLSAAECTAFSFRYPQNRLYPQIKSAATIKSAIHTLSSSIIITIPTAIQNIANPHILFIFHFDSVWFFIYRFVKRRA